MKGYIYTMFRGADPAMGWRLTDPIFGKVPTLGACMPNIRRVVTEGDYIFAVSGQVHDLRQYVVGGFQVSEKINALAAYERFPEYRQLKTPDGTLRGNIIVNESGQRSEVDYHSNFEKRVEDYIIGKNPVTVSSSEAVSRARLETVDQLSLVFDRKGQKVSDIIGRWRRLDEDQISHMLDWLRNLNQAGNQI